MRETEEKTETQTPVAPAAGPDELSELRAQLDAKEKQLREYIDRLKRSQADFENYKKRIQKEQEQLFLLMEDRLLADFLPLYDNLERAFRGYHHHQDQESFVEGLERIFAQFYEFLARRGIVPIPALGEVFDPARHEALITVESAEGGGRVLEEFERGYLRDGRVIRPSKVKVSKRGEPKVTTPASAQAPAGAPKEG
jgi:molecular chaperone GrpE